MKRRREEAAGRHAIRIAVSREAKGQAAGRSEGRLIENPYYPVCYSFISRVGHILRYTVGYRFVLRTRIIPRRVHTPRPNNFSPSKSARRERIDFQLSLESFAGGGALEARQVRRELMGKRI